MTKYHNLTMLEFIEYFEITAGHCEVHRLEFPLELVEEAVMRLDELVGRLDHIEEICKGVK